MSESLGEAVLTLDADQGPLNTALAALDGSVTSQIGALGTKLKTQFGGALKAAAAVGFAALAAGAAMAGKALYDLGADFDNAYDKIRVSTGATGAELEGLKDDFKNVVSSVPVDFETAAEAISEVNRRLGLTGAPLRERTKQFLELSRVTGTDLKTNIEAVSKAFVDWEVPVRDQAEALDGFFRLSQETGISVDELASSVQKFGSPLRNLGFTLAESAAMFATFEKAGVNTATMVPGLKLAIANLVDPTDDLSAKFKQLGIDAKSPEDQLKQVFALLEGDGLSSTEQMSLAMDVFGSRAGADLAEAVKQGRFEVSGMIDVFENGKETIRGAAKDTNDLSENWQIFKNKVLVGLEPLATFVFEKVNAGLLWLIKTFKQFSRDGTGSIEDIKAVLRTVGAVLSAVWDFVKTAFEGIVTVIRGALKVITGVVEAFSALFRGDWRGLWTAVKKIFSGVWDMIRGIVKTVTAAIMATLRAFGDKAVSVIKGALQAVLNVVKGAWEGVKSATSAMKDRIVNLIRDAWDRAKEITRTVVGAIVDFVRELPGKILGALGSLGERLWNVAKNAFGRFKDGVVSVAGTVIDFVKGLPGKILGAIGEVGNLLFEKGKQIIGGLIDGLRSRLAELKAIVDEILDTVTGGMMAKPKGMSAPVSPPASLGMPSPGVVAGATLLGAPVTAGTAPVARPQVTVHFAGSASWLKRFVQVEIGERDRAQSGVVSAGVRPR